MKKILVTFLCVGMIILLILSLTKDRSTIHNAKPEKLLKNDNKIDLLIINDTVYVNAYNIDWINNLILNKKSLLGYIQRTNVIMNFKNFDATYLDVDSKIYSAVERDDILLVLTKNGLVPYYKYVEG